jgi:hypothetical protein
VEEQADAACSSSNAARIRSRKEISDESRILSVTLGALRLAELEEKNESVVNR